MVSTHIEPRERISVTDSFEIRCASNLTARSYRPPSSLAPSVQAPADPAEETVDLGWMPNDDPSSKRKKGKQRAPSSDIAAPQNLDAAAKVSQEPPAYVQDG